MMSPSCWPGTILEVADAAPSYLGLSMMSGSKPFAYWHLRHTIVGTFVLKVGIRKSARVAPLCE
jgi:hypothetical protein